MFEPHVFEDRLPRFQDAPLVLSEGFQRPVDALFRGLELLDAEAVAVGLGLDDGGEEFHSSERQRP